MITDASFAIRQVDLLALIGRDVQLRRVASTNGGEWAGPCPFCGGDDRFRVWPQDGDRGRFWCRQCEAAGDAIDYIRKRDNMSFVDACARLGAPVGAGANEPRRATARSRISPPSATWQDRARAFVAECQDALWAGKYTEGLNLLRARGLHDDTIRTARLGLNVQTRYESPSAWGLGDNAKRVWLPRGIVIPWQIGADLWRVNIRRPNGDVRAGEPKYIGPAGCRAGLYGADGLSSERAAIVVEGELDALTVQQCAGDLLTAVATGSTCGGRAAVWVARLSLCPTVLVSFDNDDAGEKAARWWLAVLANAKRWRPYWGDANAMAQDGADVRAWVVHGLGVKPPEPSAGWTDDPRPDLPEDHALWQALLSLAQTQQGDLAAILHGIRCEGARIVETAGGLRIEGDYDDYARDRATWLLPRRDALTRLLTKLQEMQEQN